MGCLAPKGLSLGPRSMCCVFAPAWPEGCHGRKASEVSLEGFSVQLRHTAVYSIRGIKAVWTGRGRRYTLLKMCSLSDSLPRVRAYSTRARSPQRGIGNVMQNPYACHCISSQAFVRSPLSWACCES